LTETYYAGAYWPARPESAEDCARRARSFFFALAQHNPLFTRWFKPRKARNQLPSSFEPDLPTLREVFAEDRTRNDEGRVIEDLGFTLLANTEGPVASAPSEHASLRIKCGGYAEHMGSNACVLSLPSTGPYSEQLLTSPSLTEVVRAMALAWEPDWGIATSDAHREAVTQRGTAGTFVGWVMYFSLRRGPVPPLPAPARVEPVDNLGTLVTLTPERFTVSNPTHLELAAHVHTLLEHAGLLVPVNPRSSSSPP
jgi:hypothetical protein